MKTSQHFRVLAGLMGVLVVVLAGVCGYQYWAIAATSRNTTAQQSALAAARRLATEQQKLAAAQQELGKRIVVRRASWAWSDQLPLTVAQVTRLVEAGGAKVNALQPQPVVVRQQLARFPVRVTLETSIDRLADILAQVRKANPLLAVDHLSVHVGKTPDDPLQVEMTLSSFVMLDGPAQTGGRR